MHQHESRHGERGSIPYRTSRFYSVGHEWWFSIRRGPDQGPYPSKAAAKLSLIEFLNDQLAFEKHLAWERNRLRSERRSENR